eukprot:TRINITY_DN1068_c0_g2_i1.p1 TRINITY_DN1068_c0_g2~~TRINITY_DN1068_c0_g2_i1.p1  ORF type:complete len:138 (-),score=50.37 TRINITY_DN1068_c0_g2_i1:41-454(-)
MDHHQGGYSKDYVDVHILEEDITSTTTTPPFPDHIRDELQNLKIEQTLLYTATPENKQFLGDDTTHSIAKQIIRSVGPSGPNIDYLLNLANSLKEMNVEDDHVFELEREVLLILNNDNNNNNNDDTQKQAENIINIQ